MVSELIYHVISNSLFELKKLNRKKRIITFCDSTSWFHFRHLLQLATNAFSTFTLTNQIWLKSSLFYTLEKSKEPQRSYISIFRPTLIDVTVRSLGLFYGLQQEQTHLIYPPPHFPHKWNTHGRKR